MQLQLELSYVRHVLKAHRLPGELVRRATKYMRHMASGGGGISLQAVEQLPTGLAIEVMGELVGKLLAQGAISQAQHDAKVASILDEM